MALKTLEAKEGRAMTVSVSELKNSLSENPVA